MRSTEEVLSVYLHRAEPADERARPRVRSTEEVLSVYLHRAKPASVRAGLRAHARNMTGKEKVRR